jgi:hypothetical protein
MSPSTVIALPFYVSVDDDCDSSTCNVVVGKSSNFFPGLRATPCNTGVRLILRDKFHIK